MNYKILNLGDQAITLEFGFEINEAVNARVLAVHANLKKVIADGLAPGIIESIPTFRSLTVCFNPLILLPDEAAALVEPCIVSTSKTNVTAEHWQIPCCYEAEYAEDLDEVGRLTHLSTSDVLQIHKEQVYKVFMLGFLPGFGFMGSIDPRLELPRRSEPRVAVPKGSVAIANQLTAVYPSQSPGGWHLIGRTPIELFDASMADPVLLSAGDSVSFNEISKKDFCEIETAISNSSFDVRSECKVKGAGL